MTWRFAGGAHQVDEDVFQPGVDLASSVRPVSAMMRRERRARSARGVAAADVQRGAEGHDLLDRRQRRALAPPGRGRSLADHRPGVQRWLAITSRAVPCASRLAVGDVGEPMAALGFVHVMRADQHREAARGELVDFLPEIAARLGIDAGGRLVEQQQLRLVDQAGGEREALLPAAGKRAGELVCAAAPGRGVRGLRRPLLAPLCMPYMRATKSQVFLEWSDLPRS